MPAIDGFNPENPYGADSVVVATPAIDGVVQRDDTIHVSFDQGDPVQPNAPAAPVAPVVDPAAPVAPVVAPAAAPPAEGAPVIPTGGFDKFYNKETGAYNWEAHAREADFRVAQKPGIRANAPAAKAAPGTDAAQAAVAEAGLDWAELTQTINADGGLRPDQYATLAAAGIPAEIVDSFIGATANVGSLAADAALRYVGGTNDAGTNQVAMDSLLEWAGGNLTEAEIDQHDALLNSPNWRISVDALQALRGAQPQPTPDPVPLQGANSISTVGDGAFKDFNEQIKAQQDPRYAKDENYRQEVIRRIGLGFRG